jgi:hypothetical protein
MSNDKPNPGAMQIKAGKMKMYLNDEWVDFGPAYIAKDMRRIARPLNGRQHAYAPFLRRWAGELESQGLLAIQNVQGRLKAFYGCSEKWMAQDCKVWHGWLQQIWQFRNCTGKKDKPLAAESNKNFRENFDKVFTKAA